MIISKREGNKDYYYIYDAQGNVIHLADADGRVVIHYEYDAFGSIVYQRGSLNQSYQYQTKEYDPQSSLVYFGARYYDPATGRWTTPDPLGMVDGPNRYVYCSNNPIGFVDSWGLCKGKIDLSGMASGFVACGLLLSDDVTVIGIADDLLIPFIIVAGAGYTIYQNREALGELVLTASSAITIATVIYFDPWKDTHASTEVAKSPSKISDPKNPDPGKGWRRWMYVAIRVMQLIHKLRGGA